eukprot:15360-Pelagomonas_calceolata.AAC.1
MAPPQGNVSKDRLCQAQAHSAQRGTKLPGLGVTSVDGRVSARVLRGHRTVALDMSVKLFQPS